MIPPRLPPELIASIFSILGARNDLDSIRACSLLSTQYSNLARQYLFSIVKLKLKSSVSIRDLVRRVQGLSQLLQSNTHINRSIKTLEILDTYPVYDSQWITQQSCLPHFISLLDHVQSCTFGCEVGFLAWSFFSPELQTSLRKLLLSPQLKALSLRNLGSVPVVILRNPVVRYISLNHVSILSLDLLDDESESLLDDLPATQLVYLNIRTVSTENTESVSRLIESQGQNLKIIKWRCWEGAVFLFLPLKTLF
jgi:hypothetical protein